ncbi:FUSC family protein [Haloechinothrix salitolerans]|uniref:FUSC family protein n=1 Tax=Haloechinothrix salitolerans TaxID=926830 RepID=A0ABW2BX78_9PSEU
MIGERPEPSPRPLSEVAAPHWLAHLLSTTKVPVHWGQLVRAAAALSVPIAIGTATGHTGVGIEAALGALCGTFVARRGPYRFRLRHMGWGTLAGATGFLTGGVAAGNGWVTSAVIVALAVVSAVISTVGATASAAGLQLLIFAILGAGQPLTSGPYLATGWFLAGAAWAVLLAIAAWPVRATAPERAAVAAVYEQMVAMLTARQWREAALARQRLTAALNDAYDALLTARSRLEGRDETYRRLFTLLSNTTPVIEAAVAAVKTRHRTPRHEIDILRAIADAIRADRPLPDPSPTPETALGRAMHDLRRDTDTDAHTTPHTRRSYRDRLTTWLDDALGGPATWTHAARLAACIALAEIASRQLDLERSYWVALTVALVLKPDFGSVFARAVLRAGGTVIGVLLGAIVLLVEPRDWALPLAVAVLAAPLPLAKERNYGLFAISMTPLVIVLVDLTQAGSATLLSARLVDTAVGCAIVLVFGYLCWPGSRRPQLGTQMAAATDTLAHYAARALAAHPAGHSTLRRTTYRTLSDLRVAAQRLIPEPSRAGRNAAAWWPTIIGLERLTDAITRAAVDTPSPAADVDQVVTAIREIAAAIRADRPPADQPLPAAGPLAVVAADITALYGALRGPLAAQE